MKSTFWSRG